MCGIIEMTRATRDVASHVDVRNGGGGIEATSGPF